MGKRKSGVARGLFGRFLRNNKGATALEFALVGFPFLFTFLGLLEVALIFLASSALENGTQEAARTIRTMQLQNAGGGVNDFRQNVCDAATGLISCGTKLNVDVQVYPSFTVANMNPPVTPAGIPIPGQFTPGTNGQVVVVKVYYVWDLFTPGIGLLLGNMGSLDSRLLLSTSAFRNEP